MIFMIRIDPLCSEIIDKLYMTSYDIVSVIQKHIKYCGVEVKDARIFYLPSFTPEGDVYRGNGYLIWHYNTTECEIAESDAFIKNPIPHCNSARIEIYSNPPELKDTFDFKALGLEDILVNYKRY